MTKYLFFVIQSKMIFNTDGLYYEKLKKPLEFNDDPYGISNWVLRFPLTIYSSSLL